jgi:hypothetical protein
VPGFLLSLDFFHAYDRVSIQWLDRVIEAMSFGVVLSHWVATLQRQASACFMLHTLLPDMAVEFSIRQGDPAGDVFFVIYIEPFLVRLEDLLRGLFMAGLREASFGYMDDVNMLGEDEEDIIIADWVCRAFEEASGAILNRNRKTVILGLGSWEGCQEWPLPWLQAAQHAKLYGVVMAPQFSATLAVSWDLVIGGIEKVLRELTARRLPMQRQRAAALETFVVSKAWFLAQILPLPNSAAACLRHE